MNSLARRTFLLMGAALSAATLFAQASVAETIPPDRRVALSGYDPVAYFTDGRPEKGSEDFWFAFDDAVYLFRNAEHRSMFVAEPERYAPQYAGWCAAGVSKGYKTEPDPEAWVIADGKLYVLMLKERVADFKRDTAAFVDMAETNWPRLRGTVGFLMNEFQEAKLKERLAAAETALIHPLLMRAKDGQGRMHEHHAINEVSLFRQTHQAARLRILIDGKERLADLVADGAMVATPAGSTAYNLSAQGPIIPINAPLLALTPISPFRPRRWHGALLPDKARVTLQVLESAKRPVAAVADHDEVRDVASVDIGMDHSIAIHMLFDPGHSLDERILREQFGY